jgi:hypothetical protein
MSGIANSSRLFCSGDALSASAALRFTPPCSAQTTMSFQPFHVDATASRAVRGSFVAPATGPSKSPQGTRLSPTMSYGKRPAKKRTMPVSARTAGRDESNRTTYFLIAFPTEERRTDPPVRRRCPLTVALRR